MIIIACLILFCLLPCGMLSAQEVGNESVPQCDIANREVKTDWNFGALPGLSYDADKGFLYGITLNIFDYYDGSLYPGYRHYIYVECSYTTKKVGTFRLFYESDYMVENHKLQIDLSYLPDIMNDFYGFNGSQSVFNHSYENSGSAEYLSRYFYKHRSDLLRLSAMLRGKIAVGLQWNAGAGLFHYDEVTIKHGVENPELFGLYKEWGLIDKNISDGGWHPFVCAGLNFDGRDQRVSPSKGIYLDLFLTYYAAFGKEKDYNCLKINADIIHFTPLVGNRLVLACRVATQNTLAGTAPYYLDSYHNVLFIDHNRYYGLGGATTLRGVMKNRIWVPGFLTTTVELRSRLMNFKFARQFFYLGTNVFVDAGLATQAYHISEDYIMDVFSEQLSDPNSWLSQNNMDVSDFFNFNSNVFVPHFGGGVGLKFVMNENFVLSAEWAMTFNRQDNYTIANFYVGLGYMF
ncbi:MAG: BamA/TamA family outer membrane protein [Candidatus Limimorpha sp.]